MRDEIRNICGNECFILNTDDSSSHGTHWVAVNVTGGTTYYFDSFCLKSTEKSSDIARSLDFTTHLNFRNQTKLYAVIYVYISSTECVIVK